MLFVLWLLPACAWVAEDEHAAFIDADGDGYYSDRFSDGNDCNDGLAAVHPDAVEICDGKDQNCDGVADDGLGGGYLDADGDGHGDPMSPHPECGMDDGYVASSDDCDDSDAAVNPEAVEVCDGLDNDCDGGVDDQAVWWEDADGDLYGDPEAPVTGSCDSPPDGMVDNDDDCDDANAAINPAATDVVGDDGDQNCDGVDGTDADGDGFAADWSGGDDCDDDDPATFPGAAESESTTACLRDADHDGWGDTARGGTDCDDQDELTHPGADETWYDGVDQDCDGQSDYDADGDGYDSGEHGGEDCDDADQAIHPGADEVWYDAVDSDCDGVDYLVFDQVGVGESFACGLGDTGFIHCWGKDDRKQVRNAPAGTFGQLVTSHASSCALSGTGSIHCWGSPSYNPEVVNNEPTGTGFTIVALGINSARTACAVDGSEQVVCWGHPGDALVSAAPTDDGYVAVGVGYNHACTLDGVGDIACWGEDTHGQVADAPSGGGYAALAMGLYSGCALSSVGGIECWGLDSDGQVSAAPTGTGYRQIGHGMNYYCALDAGGSVHCWGDDYSGAVSTAPTSNGFASLGVGSDLGCVVNAAGGVECWGNDDYGAVSDAP